MGQFSNSFPKHFSYLCEYAFRYDLSCSFCEYPIIFHCLHCSPSCFDPDSLLLAHLWLGLSWIDSISANKRFSSPKTSSRKPYTSSKQQERQKHSAETTINVSGERREGREEGDSREGRPPGMAGDRQGARPTRAMGLEMNTEGSRDPVTSAVRACVHAGRRVQKKPTNAARAGNHKAGCTAGKGGGGDQKKTAKHRRRA